MSSPSFLRRAGPLVVARFASAVVTTVVPLVLARAMPIDEYGTYKQLFLVGATLTAVLAFGVPQSLYYFLPRTEQGRPYIVHVLVLLAGAGALAAGLVLLATPWIGELFSAPTLPEYRYALAVYAGFFLAASPLETLFTSQGRTGLAAVNYLVWDTLRAAAMTVPILLGLGLHATMWSVAGLMVIRTFATWKLALTAAPGPWWDRGALRTQLAYALPFGAAMAISVPQHSLHQWVVSAHFDPAAFAIYTVGCFQLPIVDLLYTPTTEVLMVHVGELERSGRLADAVALFRDAAARLAFVFVPTCAFLVAAAPAFIEAVFGVRFLPAVPLFRVSTLAVLFGCLPLDGLLRARGETRAILVSYVVKAMVTIPLVLVLVETMGLIGGVVSWLIAEGVGKLLLVGRLKSALQLRSARQLVGLIPVRDGLRAVIGAGVSVAVMLVWHRVIAGRFDFLPHTFFWRLFPVASDAVVFTLAYVMVLHAQGIRVLRVLSMFRRQRFPVGAPVLSAQPDPGDAAEAPVL
ncbi:MAG TPA: lipopolysaccharide biosynthesis protein [Myxococcaceae bacterium]|nr:lipopolysaccharide biosynthesis protein [Myxococcaceae bacterium]